MKFQRATKLAQKDQSKISSSSLHQTSLNHVAVHPLLELQRTVGNQAVLALLRSQNTHVDPSTQAFSEPRFGHDFSRIPIHSTQTAVPQAKLTVDQPGDVYEQEADQVAEQVMRMPDKEPLASDEEDEAKTSLMRKQSSQTGDHAGTDIHSVPPIVHDVLNGGGGQPLDTTIRAFMEPRFGHDFSKVRVHTDERAVESARSVNALAYTVGRDVVFEKGQYEPGTRAGQRLLAHELTHIVQQQNTSSDIGEQRATRNPLVRPTLVSPVALYRQEAKPGAAPPQESQSQKQTGASSQTPATSTTPDVYVERLRTEATEDAVIIYRILRNNLWLAPWNQADILAIVKKWTEKPRETPRSSRLTAFDYFIVALRNAVIYSWFTAEQSFVFDQLFTRLDKKNRVYFQTCIQTSGGVYRDVKPLKEESEHPEAAIGPTPDYDSFCDPNGRPTDPTAFIKLVHNWQQLEQVYADAAQNNPRAKRFVQEGLELHFAELGIVVANRFCSWECRLLPVYKDIPPFCIPDWDASLGFLRKDKPGSVRLRQIVVSVYEKQAKQLGMYDDLIKAAVNAALTGIAVKGALGAVARESEVAAATGAAKVPPSAEAKGAIAGEAKAEAAAGAAKIAPPAETKITPPAEKPVIPAEAKPVEDPGRKGSTRQRELGTGTNPGLPPNEETIRVGTVEMEKHPNYQNLRAEIERLGFTFKEMAGAARVEIIEYVNIKGEHIRFERYIYYKKGMMYLDLEHEYGHILQLKERLSLDLPHKRLIEKTSEGHTTKWKSPNQSEILTTWMDKITEYHNRLKEYLELKKRGADEKVLFAHRRGVVKAQAEYEEVISRSKGKKLEWQLRYFRDIPDLENEFTAVTGIKFSSKR